MGNPVATALRTCAGEVAALQTKLADADRRFATLSAQLASREADVASQRASLAVAEQALAVRRQPGLQLVRLAQTDKRPRPRRTFC